MPIAVQQSVEHLTGAPRLRRGSLGDRHGLLPGPPRGHQRARPRAAQELLHYERHALIGLTAKLLLHHSLGLVELLLAAMGLALKLLPEHLLLPGAQHHVQGTSGTALQEHQLCVLHRRALAGLEAAVDPPGPPGLLLHHPGATGEEPGRDAESDRLGRRGAAALPVRVRLPPELLELRGPLLLAAGEVLLEAPLGLAGGPAQRTLAAPGVEGPREEAGPEEERLLEALQQVLGGAHQLVHGCRADAGGHLRLRARHRLGSSRGGARASSGRCCHAV
mmetsp:Transcript_35179/g.100724  ORF Transcript_35179/g.100724 Transcript_35179/m.100724 type:complete len:277 (+) Transcript_35179:1726-2556(+)